MRKFFYLLLLIPQLICSQSAGVLFTDFSSNVPGFNDQSYRKTLESIIGELNYSVTCVNRDSLSSILNFIQKEENLRRDFNDPKIKNGLSAANVDYVGYGNFKKFFGRKIDFQLEFVKTSGDNVLSSKTFVKSFKEDELIETSNFADSMRQTIKEIIFTSEHGLIERGFVEEVSQQLKVKDKEISILNSKLSLSKKKIDSLNLNINDLNDEVNKNRYRKLDDFQRHLLKNLIESNKGILLTVEIEFTYEPKINPELKKFIYQLENLFAKNGLKTLKPRTASCYLVHEAFPFRIAFSANNELVRRSLLNVLGEALMPNDNYAKLIWENEDKINLHFFGLPNFQKNGKVLIE